MIDKLKEICYYIESNVPGASTNYNRDLEERFKKLDESIIAIKIVEITFSDQNKFNEAVIKPIRNEYN